LIDLTNLEADVLNMSISYLCSGSHFISGPLNIWSATILSDTATLHSSRCSECFLKQQDCQH